MQVWKYKEQGTHTHVTVYINGAYSGELHYRNDEFMQWKESVKNVSTIRFEEIK